MLNKTVWFGLILWSVISLANTNDDMATVLSQSIRQTSAIPSSTIEALNIKSSQAQSEHKGLIDDLIKKAGSNLKSKQKPQGADGALLFVSFSMPSPLLFALVDEAALYNIPVVINGLVDGDFKKTIETFKRLSADAKKQHLNFKGVSIDPVWFTQFQIKSVPALVVTERLKSIETEGEDLNQPFDVVYGNARIKNSLELISNKGDAAAARAKTILEQGHV